MNGGKMKKKVSEVPEVVIPKGYDFEEVLDMTDDFEDEEPILQEEVKIRFE